MNEAFTQEGSGVQGVQSIELPKFSSVN